MYKRLSMVGENNPSKRLDVRKKISNAKKGKSTWNKGNHLTNEWKDKISKSNKGKCKFIMTEEIKRKIGIGVSKAMTPLLRKKLSEAKKGIKGSNWKGGLTPEYIRIRHSIETELWRESVFTRDNYTCQKTGIKGGYLHPHHIKNFSKYPELRFAIDNGITFNEVSHKEFHKIYGRYNNTEKQLIEYLGGNK